MNTTLKILVIIPAYNEEASVAKVVREIQAVTPDIDILVVDDGSDDCTTPEAAAAGAIILTLPINSGVGNAMLTGLHYAMRYNYDYVIRLDGDGQHNPQHINALLAPLFGGKYDMTIGSRFLQHSGYRSTRLRRAGSAMLTSTLWLLTRQTFTDPTSGFTAFSRKSAEYLAAHFPQDYPEPETIFLLARRGVSICEISAAMRPRASGASSLSGVRPAVYMLKSALALFVELLRKPNL